MQGGGAELQQGAAVLAGAVAGMPFQSIAGVTHRQAADQSVAALLGQHAGSRNRHTTGIAPHHGALAARPQAQWQNPINQQQLRWSHQLLEGAEHGQLGGHADAMTIDFSGRGLADGPVQRQGLDPGHERCTAPGRELLAVGEACSSQLVPGLSCQHHRCGEHGAEQTTAAHLINSGDALRRWDPVTGHC